MNSSLSQLVSLPPMLASVSSKASSILTNEGFLEFITNSTAMALIVLLSVFWLSKKATKNMTLVPHTWQNRFEFVVEFLYNQIEGIVGKKQAPRAFPLLATLFIFILVSNWFGLVPGVGSIGWGEGNGPLSLSEVHDPLLRPGTADLNTTLGLALSAFLVWIWITYQEIGIWGFIVHTFGPKGGLKGIMGFVVALVFLFVGVIEIISILFRPVTLSLRLYGNIYAGENVIHTMSDLLAKAGEPWASIGSVLLPFPFYFMELLVGMLQAIVFTLLCAVYIQLSTTHDDHGHEEEGHDHH